MARGKRNSWLPESDSDFNAKIAGWIDEQGNRHLNVPRFGDPNVDALIVYVAPKDDEEAGFYMTVPKVSRVPDMDEWLRLVRIASRDSTGVLLEYELD